jgi:hypothetical protein
VILALTQALLASVVLAATPVELQTLDGQKLSGELKELSVERIVLSSADGEKSVDTSNVLGLSVGKESPTATPVAPAKISIELVDGSRLRAASFTATKGTATVELQGGAKAELATSGIRYVRFDDMAAGSAELTKQWEEILAQKAGGDVIVLRKKSALDYAEGVVRRVADEDVDFELGGETLELKRNRVEAVLYFRAAEPELADARCVVHLSGGSHIDAANAELKGENLAVTSSGGAQLELPLSACSRIDFSVGKIQFLSDLEPDAKEITPYIGGPASLAAYTSLLEPRRDTNFGGEPLKIAGVQHAKGVALHSRSRLSYRLGGKFRQFSALAGIDDAMASSGNVVLRISGDGRTLWEGTIKGGEEPKQLDLDLTGVRRLELLVDYGDDLDVGDHLLLCEAKLLK